MPSRAAKPRPSLSPPCPPRGVPSAGSGVELDRTLGPAGGVFTPVISNPRGSFPSSRMCPQARDTRFYTGLFWAGVKNANVTVPSHKTFSRDGSGACGLSVQISPIFPVDSRASVSERRAQRSPRSLGRVQRLDRSAQRAGHGRAAADPSVPLVQGPAARLLLPAFLCPVSWASPAVTGPSGRAVPSSAHVEAQCALVPPTPAVTAHRAPSGRGTCPWMF